MPELRVGSVEWWLERLTRRLDRRHAILHKLADYYDGRHPLLFATDRFIEAFGDRLSAYADNFTARVVDVVAERLYVDGFRFGDDEAAADEAWRIWQDNQMDRESSLLFREALVKREASIIVWAGEDPDTPAMSVEDPLQVVVETAPGNRLRRRAALKRWSEDGVSYATLFLPEAIYKFKTDRSPLTGDAVSQLYGTWQRREVSTEPWPLPNPLGEVPVVPVINRPRLDGEGRSEIEPIIPLQDAINKTGSDALVAAEFSAFRQRFATGLDVPEDPVTGEPVQVFQAAVERLWTSDDPNTKFGEFAETNLANYVTLLEMQVQHLAAVSGFPLHYLLSTGVVPSGESQTAVESPLVNKVRDRINDFSDPIEEAVRLAFAVKGDDARARRRGQSIWRDPERRTPSEFVDALVKELALGVPEEILWEKRGYTKQEIDRIKAIRAQKQLLAAAIAPPAPPIAPAVTGGE